MRELTSHKVNGLNGQLDIHVCDEPGTANACHEYEISWGGAPIKTLGSLANPCFIQFQDGPIAKSGVNGVSNEALLAIVEDRLACYESGSLACKSNAIALLGVRTALRALKD